MRRRIYYPAPIVRAGVGDITSSITDAAVASLTPAVEQVMVEKVLPAMGIAIVLGAISAAAVGSWFATRPVRARRIAL